MKNRFCIVPVTLVILLLSSCGNNSSSIFSSDQSNITIESTNIDSSIESTPSSESTSLDSSIESTPSSESTSIDSSTELSSSSESQKIKYKLTLRQRDILKSGSTNLGTIEILNSSDGKFETNEEVTVEAHVNENNKKSRFLGWATEENKILSSEKTYTFKMGEEDLTLVGLFAEKVEKQTTINFGNYPQSKVNDENVISKLNDNAGILPGKDNSSSWTSYKAYQGITNGTSKELIADNSVDYMWFQDIELEGSKYRGVYFDSYRPMNTNGQSNEEKSLQDNRGYLKQNVYWFKYEPISWKVLSDDGLIFSSKILDIHEFYHDASKHEYNGKIVCANNYETSNVRSWLNDTFMKDSLDIFDRVLALENTVKNDLQTTLDTKNEYICNDTKDKVFLLSEADLNNADYGFKANEDRISKVTDYAKCMGAYINVDSENGRYWTRSPDPKYSYRISDIDQTGKVNYWQSYGVAHGGVRPAIVIDNSNR